MSVNMLHFNTRAIENKIIELVEQTETTLAKNPYESTEPSVCRLIIDLESTINIPNNMQGRYEDNLFWVSARFEEQFDLSTQTLREALYDIDGTLKQSLDLNINYANLVPDHDASAFIIEPSDLCMTVTLKTIVPTSALESREYYYALNELDNSFEFLGCTGSSVATQHEERFDISSQTLDDKLHTEHDKSADFNVNCWSQSNTNDEIAYNFESSVSGLVSGSTSDSSINPSDCYVTACISMIGPVPNDFIDFFVDYNDNHYSCGKDCYKDYWYYWYDSDNVFFNLAECTQIMYEEECWIDSNFGFQERNHFPSLDLNINFDCWNHSNGHNEQIHGLGYCTSGFIPGNDTLSSI